MLDLITVPNIFSDDRTNRAKLKAIANDYNSNNQLYIHLGCKDNPRITTSAFHPLPQYIVQELAITGLKDEYAFEIVHTLDVYSMNSCTFFVAIDEVMKEFASVEVLGDRLKADGKIKYEIILSNSHKFCRIVPAATETTYIDDSAGVANKTIEKIVSILPMRIEQEYYKPQLRQVLTTRQRILPGNIFINAKSQFAEERMATKDPLFEILPFMDPSHPEYSAPLSLLIQGKLFTINNHDEIDNNATFIEKLKIFLHDKEHEFTNNMIVNMGYIGNADIAR